MVFASLPISVEKNRVGPGMAGVPSRLDRCDVKHEIVALILTGIRGNEPKRRRWRRSIEAFEGASRYPHPGCFGAKSPKPIDKKGVEFWRVPKSAQECEKKRDSSEGGIEAKKVRT